MTSRTVRYVLRSLATARQVCGFLLVCAAVSGTAQAIDITVPNGTVPEMDAGTLGSALTLFVGGILMLKNRFQRHS